MFQSSLLVAIPIGFFATAIIVVNNLRDRTNDLEVGKKTMAVRFGEKFTRLEYVVLMAGAYGMLVPIGSEVFLGGTVEAPRWLYLPLLSLPLAWGS